MGKIEKLTKDIEKLKMDIEKYEDKIREAREYHKKGRIDKDGWTKARHRYQEKIRVAQVSIRRKEKARLHFEKDEKEKREKEQKEQKEQKAKDWKERKDKDKIDRKKRRDDEKKEPSKGKK